MRKWTWTDPHGRAVDLGENVIERGGETRKIWLWGGQQGYEKNIQRGYWGEHTDTETEERYGEGEKGREENGA